MRAYKDSLMALMVDFVENRQRSGVSEHLWRAPLVGFADAGDEHFVTLKEAVSTSHALPDDLLPGAKSVIVYFVPIVAGVVKSNISGRNASRLWAQAYILTNELIYELNRSIVVHIETWGGKAVSTPTTHNFDSQILLSDWSHRHVGWIAGLGIFGINNMLITDKGCAGRMGSVVTDIRLESTKRPTTEYCLWKYNGSYGLCIRRCVNGALTEEGFDRFACYATCLENAVLWKQSGKADVCGKCVVGLPCSSENPESRIERSS